MEVTASLKRRLFFVLRGHFEELQNDRETKFAQS